MSRHKQFGLQTLGLIAAAALLFMYPIVLPKFYTALAIEIIIMALFALSFNLMFGYAGMLSFGQAVFYGIGAYTTALVLKHVTPSLAVAMLSCIVVSFLAALLIGAICVRFTKTYFIMLTVAFGELMYVIGHKWATLTGGDDGLVGIPIPKIAIPGLPVFDLQDMQVYYYFALVIAGVSALALWMIVNSRFGHVLRAIRDNRERAEFLGLNVRRHLLLCYAIGGLFAGVSGALLIPFEGMVSLETLHFGKSGDPIIMSILGGTRFFLGPVVGAALFILIKDTIQTVAEFWMLWMGMIFVATVMFLPGGVVGFLSSLRLFRPRAATPPEKEE
jgi:branched-chain amino acid transport system permease protein